jgi:predicted Rossmann fold nucleotide-binding protein DprA/Smf involved in DNA uptake
VVRIVAGVPQLLEDLGLMVSAAFPARAPGRLLVPPSRPVRAPSAAARRVELSPREDHIARALLDGGSTADELVAMTGMPVAAVLAGLTALEAAGLAVGGFGRYRVAGFLAVADPGSAPGDASPGPVAADPAA